MCVPQIVLGCWGGVNFAYSNVFAVYVYSVIVCGDTFDRLFCYYLLVGCLLLVYGLGLTVCLYWGRCFLCLMIACD